MNVSALPSLQHLRAYSAAQNAIVIANTQPITELRGQINNLSSAQVDAILIALDGNGLNGGTVDLSGQNPPAPPMGPGQTAQASLIGKGWTVTVDPQPTWAPATEVIPWIDGGGAHNGDLPAFQATADYPTVSSLNFSGSGNITSLTGLKGLPALSSLNLDGNGVSSLDCSNMLSLTNLICSNNLLTSINVNGCSSLGNFSCLNNLGVTSVPLTGCVSLSTFNCTNCSILSLDFSPCPLIQTIECSANGTISSITFSGNSNLQIIYCFQNVITSLDLSSLTALVICDLSENQLTSIDITGMCSHMNLLDVHGNPLVNTNATTPTYIINRLLANLDGNGINNGNAAVKTLGGISPPSNPGGGTPNGIAAAASLNGKGWSVTTD